MRLKVMIWMMLFFSADKIQAASFGFEWKVGVSKTNITPLENMWLAGYGNRVSEGVI